MIRELYNHGMSISWGGQPLAMKQWEWKR